MIVTIQLLRALAALSVAFGHFPDDALPGALHFLRGAIGVDLFFVISGFIMARSAYDLNQGALAARDFFLRRLIRIYPTYALITVAIAGAIFYFSNALPPLGFLLRSISLIPMTDDHGVLKYPLITAAWTLSFEMYFYSVLALLLAFRRYSARAISVAIGAGVVLGYFRSPENAILATPLSSINLEFVFGVWIFEGFSRFSARRFSQIGAVALILGLPIFAVVRECVTNGHGVYGGMAIQYQDFVVDRWILWGLPSALVVIGSLSLERFLRQNLFTRTISLLGDSSYSLYLTHYFLIQLVLATVPLPGIRACFVLIPTLLILPALFYRWIERPLIRNLRAKFEPIPTREETVREAA